MSRLSIKKFRNRWPVEAYSKDTGTSSRISDLISVTLDSLFIWRGLNESRYLSLLKQPPHFFSWDHFKILGDKGPNVFHSFVYAIRQFHQQQIFPANCSLLRQILQVFP